MKEVSSSKSTCTALRLRSTPFVHQYSATDGRRKVLRRTLTPGIYRVYLQSTTLAQTSGVSSQHQNKEKRSYQYTSANNFRGTASTFALVFVMINAQCCLQIPIESSQWVSLSIIRTCCHTTKTTRKTQII